MTCNYRKKYEFDHDYRPNCGKTSRYDYGDNYESSYLGSNTSAISYEETIRRPRFNSPLSKSEYGRPRYSRRESYRDKSPVADYGNYSMQDEAMKKRNKQTKNDIQNVFYQLGIENDNFNETERRAWSPRRRHEYEDTLFERPENNYEFDQYFEKAKPREKKLKNYVNEDIAVEDRRKSDKKKNYPRKENDYQVYSYKEPKLHEKVFRHKEKNREKSSQSSEMLIKTTDYPILAFKDNIVSQDTSKTSSVFYLPTVYCKEKKHKSRSKHRTQSSPPGDTVVYNANVKEKNNIFTQEENNKDKQNQKNKNVSELQTEESMLSRDTKLKEDSTARTSAETQTEESLIFDHRFPITPNYKDAGSILSSILEKAGYKSKMKDGRFLKQTNGSRKYESTVKNDKNLFSYQIDVDIDPVKNNVFRSRVPQINPTTETRQIGYKKIEDTLNDNYPVKKDYIKVSDDSSIQIKTNIASNIKRSSEISAGTSSEMRSSNKKNNKYVVKNSHSEFKKYKRAVESGGLKINEDTPLDELIIKEIPESSFNKTIKYNQDNENQGGRIYNPTNFDNVISYQGKILEPQNAQVFRSVVNNNFKQSTTQRPSTTAQENKTTRSSSPKVLPQVENQMNMLPLNRQSEVIMNKTESKQQIFQGNEMGEDEPVKQQGKISVAKQRTTSVVGNRNESLKRELGVEKPNRDFPLMGIKDQSVMSIKMESKEDRPNRDSSPNVRKSQSVIRESRVTAPKTDSHLDESKSQLVMQESRMAIPNTNTSLVDGKRQSDIKQHGIDRPYPDSLLDDMKNQPLNNSRDGRPSYNRTNINDAKETKSKTPKLSKNFLTANRREQNKSKSILRTVKLSREISTESKETVKPVDFKNTEFQEEKLPTDADNLNSKIDKSDMRKIKEHKMQQSEIKNKPSQTKLSQLFSRKESKVGSKNESEVSRKSMRQSYTKKSGEYIDDERNSRIGSSSKSKINNKTSRKTFSKFFSKSKSNIGKEKDEFGDQIINKGMSKTKLPPVEEDKALEKGMESSSLTQKPSQEAQNKKKSKIQKMSKKQLRSSKSKASLTSNDNVPKNKSKVWGFLTKSKTNKKPGSTSKEPESQTSFEMQREISSEVTDTDLQRDIPSEASVKPPPSKLQREISSEASVKSEKRQKQNSVDKHNNGTISKEEKPCECIIQYVKQARECGNFFLGTTLHEQIMDILKVV